jgi:predicted negative regulator of RcsB-dependent stress response
MKKSHSLIIVLVLGYASLVYYQWFTNKQKSKN